MISTLGLFSPLKKWLLRSVLTTSLSTVNWTFLQNSLCSSGLIDNLNKHQAEMKEKLHVVWVQMKHGSVMIDYKDKSVSLRKVLLHNHSGNAW